jgi:phosphoglycolate phosphatase-like HAD superfamily hydrolase
MAEILSSWYDTEPRQRIIDFVATVTDEAGEGYVAPAGRIAVFDNDGTLWAERPAYFQLLFAVDRLREMAPEHPEWADKPEVQALLAGDMAAAAAGGMKLLEQVLAVTHADTTTDEFAGLVAAWVAAARHPTTGAAYTEMVYQPMLELLDYLRANGFATYIVSAGGVEFMRVFAEEVYGIPPQQVIGSSIKTELQTSEAGPVLMRLPAIDFIDDGAGKPVAINHFIGRRPILAFGNSDGDHEMLQWTAAGDGPRLMGLVHHTDVEREWAYDRDAVIGGLDEALDEAYARDWVVVSMKRDWRAVFPFTTGAGG